MNEPIRGTVSGPPRPATKPGRPARRASLQPERLTSIPRHYVKLFVLGVAALILYYVISDPNNANLATRSLAAIVLLVSCFPMALYLLRGKIFQVPALEAHCMFYALAFGFAGFLPVPNMGGAGTITEAMLDVGLFTTLIGLLALLAGYYLVGPKLFTKVQGLNLDRGFSLATLESLAWVGCFLAAIVSQIARHSESLAVLGQCSMYTYGLGFYLLLVLALDKKISLVSRFGVFCLLFPYQVLFNSGLGTGQLAGVVILLCWLTLVILRCWRHIPVYLLVGSFLFFVVFQPVKFYVRTLVDQSGGSLSPVAMVKAYGEGFFAVYGSSQDMLANSKDNFESSFDRINHLALLSAVIRDTPSSQPYLYGKTYIPLLTKAIPRMIWRGKPIEDLGNRWAVKYGFLSENDTTTSYNLPWLVEMYMNGGTVGVVIVMLVLGIAFRFLWLRIISVSIGAATYATGLVIAQALVFVESNLSMQLGGVIAFVIFLWVLLKIAAVLGIYSPAPAAAKRLRSRTMAVRG